MCEWCEDLRNVQPARYIGTDEPELKAWLEQRDKEKQFVYIYHKENCFYVVTECPYCHHVFTAEDYDSYD